ncbi:hypothetical protein CSB20_08565 [bacterium DOLZORAL124_64_63]|nr:MAG: hypothetical protein CSB20_08565 [bacterium DOLZORAL124_64_63]
MQELNCQYTISVPFKRLPELKGMIENREHWTLRIDDTWPYFEARWKSQKWLHPVRFVFLRQRAPKRRRGPVQLDLFEPLSLDAAMR